ncbi:hypothetical protein ACIQY8_11080 [Streptomyces albidoflavus]
MAVTLGRPRGIGAESLVSVPVGHDHLVAVVGSGVRTRGCGRWRWPNCSTNR